jgi:hypothetical protein
MLKLSKLHLLFILDEEFDVEQGIGIEIFDGLQRK